MKSFRFAVTITLFLTIISSSFVMAQCTGGTQNGTLDPITSNFQFFTTGLAGEYQTFTAVFGVQYEFSYCAAEGGSSTYDTEISLNDAFGTNVAYDDDFCASQSHLFWTATSSGTFQLLTNVFQCGTNAVTSTLAYRTVTVVGIEDKEEVETILISPNPTSGQVTISIEDFYVENLDITISDFMGRLVAQENDINIDGFYTASYDLSSLSKGIYVLTLNAGDYTRTEKIVLQ